MTDIRNTRQKREALSDTSLCIARIVAVLTSQTPTADLERDIATFSVGVCHVLESATHFGARALFDAAEGEWPKSKVTVPEGGIFVQFQPYIDGFAPHMGLWMGYTQDRVPTLILLHHTDEVWNEVVHVWGRHPEEYLSLMGADRRTHHNWYTILYFLGSVTRGIYDTPGNPA